MIAHLAGVSQPTVSRALRGSPAVTEATRSRIVRIARELNYTVDRNASSLRSKYSGTLALLLFEDPAPDESFINPFFVSMLASITRASAQRGYDLLISFQQPDNDEWQAGFEDSRKADGIILLGYGDHEHFCSHLKSLAARGIHFVRWGAVHPEQHEVSVSCDNYSGGFQVTEHLLSRGATRIAFVGFASKHYPEFLERYRGHCDALRAAGIAPDPAWQVDAISCEHSSIDAVNALLERGIRPDAVCGASDLIAIGAMKALQSHGLRVPEDVLVTGFDDIPLAGFVNPSLTTILQDTKIAGQILVDTLIKLTHNESVENQLVPTSLIVRRSTTR